MITSFNTSLDSKTTHWVGAGFGVRTGRVRTGRVGSPQAIAMAGGAAIAHGVRTTDLNCYALAAGCAD
jgi:hypothetical protein